MCLLKSCSSSALFVVMDVDNKGRCAPLKQWPASALVLLLPRRSVVSTSMYHHNSLLTTRLGVVYIALGCLQSVLKNTYRAHSDGHIFLWTAFYDLNTHSFTSLSAACVCCVCVLAHCSATTTSQSSSSQIMGVITTPPGFFHGCLLGRNALAECNNSTRALLAKWTSEV
jgi:hypothetical protein